MDGLVTLRMLGAVELSGPDGRPARAILAQPRRLALLVYLSAATPRGFHRKDTVRALFWPDADAQRARQALNRAIYVLRGALGPEVLVTRGDEEIAVAEDRVHSDVAQFQRDLERGALEAALEVYRDDLAPGFLVSGLPEFERWLEIERARLRELAVAAAMVLADREAASGRLEPAERWAHRAELLSPHDERVAVRRIGLLDRMGDRAAALSAFEELRRRLREELEIAPSPETIAQIDAIRARQVPRPGERASADLLVPAIRDTPPLGEPQLVSATGNGGPLPEAAVRSRLRRPVLAGLAILSIVTVTQALRVWPRTLMLTTKNAVPVTTAPGIEFQPALSPDGSLVAFTILGKRQATMAVRRVASAPGGSEIRPVESSTDDQTRPIWSGNGEQLRYVSVVGRGEQLEPFTGPHNGGAFSWREVDPLGGPTHSVMLPRATLWSAWSRDGGRVAFTVGDSIYVKTVAADRVQLLAVHPAAWSPHSLAWSPDGRWLAYVSGNPAWSGGWNTSPSEIWLVEPKTGQRIPVSDSLHLNVSPAWLDSRHLLFVSDLSGQREVYAIEIGPSGPHGATVKVAGTTDAHSISLSADGTRIAIAKLVARQSVRSFPLHAPRPLFAHEGEPVTSGSQVVETHDVSPDATWLAYDTNLHGDADIYKLPLGGGTPVPVRTGPTVDFSPRWSPDGREIAFYGGGSSDIWVVSAEGGVPTRLTSAPGGEELPVWSPDGLRLAFRARSNDRIEGWILTRERIGAPWSPARQLTDFGCAYLVWVPDGSGVLCGWPDQTVITLVAPSGAVLWRRDMAASGLRRLGPPAVSPDGSTLYLRATRRTEAGIWALPLAGGAPRLIVAFDDPALVVQSYPGTINVTRDRLYLTVGEFESDIWVMELVR